MDEKNGHSPQEDLASLPTPKREWTGSEVAIVGMACRFPDAPDVATFWQNLCDGHESVREFSEEDLRKRGLSNELLEHPEYVRKGVVLDAIDQFDAGFFGFSPRDASIMDPQHRVFLECAWEALEHAGYDPSRTEKAIGVFAGCGMNAYMMYNLLSNPDLMAASGEFLIRHTGNDKDFLTTRVSYELDLKGPSVNVQTACSTSLVAVHLAMQSLLLGESDMALAGGVTISLDQERGYLYQPGEILSPDGHCRSFDADSKGTIFGSGAGLVVLKRLSDALEDGDSIHGVLLGSAVNNDGRAKVGYMAPSVDGQTAVIAEALAVAGISSESISYIEAHGTGTPVGDPIEVEALTQVHRNQSDKVGYCGLGSLKTNIGHLDTAAGVAGLIKATQALKHHQMPPTLHFRQPNPRLNLENSPFYVVDELRPWDAQADAPRRAGVSSLGVGGTNAHVVMEEPPQPSPASPSRPYQLLCASGKTEAAARKNLERINSFIQERSEHALGDIAYTLHVGRAQFPHRCYDILHADTRESGLAGNSVSVTKAQDSANVALMFAGGGVQHPGMGQDLYENEPIYRQTIDEGLALLKAKEGLDLRSVLFPEDPDSTASEMARPSTGLPALFLTQMAMARQLESWGVKPGAVIGHSVGEYAAACISGVIGFEDALRLVAFRGRLFEALPEGAMLSVGLSEDELLTRLPEGVDIAAVNAESMCVASGPVSLIDELELKLADEEVDTARLKIDVAAHSSMVESMLDDYRNFVSTLKLNAPNIPFVSNISGTWLTADEAVSPDHWANHVRRTVRFSDGLKKLLENENQVLIEVGPGHALSTLTRQHKTFHPEHTVLTTMRHPKQLADDQAVLLGALGQLWCAGVPVDWDSFYQDENRRRVPAPTYPFERQRYWIEPGNVTFDSPASGILDTPDLNRRERVEDWFEVPMWKKCSPASEGALEGNWLVLHYGDTFAQGVLDELGRAGVDFVRVELSSSYSNEDGRRFKVDYEATNEFEKLLVDIADQDVSPSRVLIVDSPDKKTGPTSTLLAAFNLIHAMGSNDPEMQSSFSFLTRNAFAVDEADQHVDPSGTLLLGPARVVPKEFPNVKTYLLDVGIDVAPASAVRVLSASHEGASTVRALRGSELYVQTHKQVNLKKSVPRVKEGGTYLITGGLGGIGITLAGHLAATNERIRLALLGRSKPSARARRLIRKMEANGADVLVLQADVTDQEQLDSALTQMHNSFGHIDGAFHAAGILEDRPILLKSIEDLKQVLAPKVTGVEVLDAALQPYGPDFVALFSSTSASLGLAGQIDYAAANSFLNGYAEKKSLENGPAYTSINWGIWSEVGMASRLIQEEWDERLDEECTEAVHHALVTKRAALDDNSHLFEGSLNRTRNWVVAEHQIRGGTALFPGTAFLDLACSAHWLVNLERPPVELSSVTFPSPLPVEKEREADFRVLLSSEQNRRSFSVVSEQGGQWLVNATGFSTDIVENQPSVDISNLADRCSVSVEHFDVENPRSQQSNFLCLGDRWNCVQKIHMGEDELLATLQIQSQFEQDLEGFCLHPALLDMATGVGLDLLESPQHAGLFAPLAYDSVRIWKPIPRAFYSYVRLVDYVQEQGIARFDVRLLDDAGNVLVDIIGMTMKLIETDQLEGFGRAGAKQASRTPLEEMIEEGIHTEEGMKVLDIVLSAEAEPVLVASPFSLVALSDAFGSRRSDKQPGRNHSAIVEPRDEIEEVLVDLWSELLGVEQVSISDNFFDLGGHSLLAVRLFTRLEKRFGKALPLATLFEASTPELLANLLRGSELSDLSAEKPQTNGQSKHPGNSHKYLVPIQTGKPKRVPFFCVHGAGGNVLNFRDLAVRIGQEQPFYGLKARGADGEAPPHESIEEMAQAYLEEITTLQSDGPYLLGGYSGGGVVAFEMAQQLHRSGKEVSLVAFLDTFRPGIVEEEGVTSRKANIARLIDRGPGYLIDWAKRRMEYERWKRTKQQVDSLSEQEQPLPFEMREIQMTSAYHNAANKYHIEVLDSIPVVLYTARDRAAEHDHVSDHLGWGPFITEGPQIEFVPGDHDSLMREPNVSTLAKRLKRQIEKTVTSATAQSAQAI